MSNKKIVVVDEGSAQIKLTWIDDATRQINTFVMPSMVGDEAGTDPVGNLLKTNYKIGDNEYYVSEKIVDPLTTKLANYQVSEENRALTHEALRKAGFGGDEICVIATLPVTQFFLGEGNRRDVDLINTKKKNLTGDIENMTKEPLAEISKVNVAPESIPAWFDLAIDDEGEWDDELYESDFVMVIDIGGTTTDLTVIDGEGNPLKKRTIPVGVYDIANKLKTELIQAGKAKSLPRAHLDNVLRTGTYRNIDCTSLITKAAKSVKNQILRNMREFEGDSMALDRILFVGGGSAIIGEDLAVEYDNRAKSYIPNNPDLSVARGLIKLEMSNSLAEAEA